MKTITAVFALALPFAAASAIPARAEVGPCELSKTEIEKFVCKDKKLKNLDEHALTVFGRAIVRSPKPEQREAIISAQLDFQGKLEKCGPDVACLKESYSARINELIDLILRAK